MKAVKALNKYNKQCQKFDIFYALVGLYFCHRFEKNKSESSFVYTRIE